MYKTRTKSLTITAYYMGTQYVLTAIINMRCYTCNTKINDPAFSKALICQSCSSGFVPVSFIKNITLNVTSKAIGTDQTCQLNYTTLFLYDFTLKQALQRFKFKKEIRLCRLFAGLFLEHFDLLNPPDLIVPVPSHIITTIKRGFVPMFLIAKKIASVSGIKYSYIVRKHFFNLFGQNQKRQNRNTRLSKKGTRFYITKSNISQIEGKKILLLDDVITTESTISECAELLYKSGAKEVEALVLAATPI